MNATVEDLRSTIIPKSDQLNAEQLLGGPMTVTVTEVCVKDSEEQPVVVHYAGEAGRPFKPCKTMRKVLIHAWGADGRQWAGRSMTLYNDPAVKFGGEDVGGIRISHMTDIEHDIKVSLTSTRGKKAKYEIRRLVSSLARQLVDIARSPTMESLEDNFKAAYRSTKSQTERAQLTAAKDKRKDELTKPAVPSQLDEYRAQIDSATDSDTAAVVLDNARSTLGNEDYETLADVWRTRWPRA